MVSVEDGCLESRSGLKREVELGFLCELKNLLLQVSTACCPDSRARRDQEQGGGAGLSRESRRAEEQGGGAGLSREPGEIKSREVELDSQESPEELKSREVERGSQESPGEMRSRAGRWSWTLRRVQER